MPRLLKLSILCVAAVAVKHTCVQNHPALRRSGGGSGAQAYSGGGRALQADSWAPIRIVPSFDPNFGTDPAFSAGTADWVKQQVLPAAIGRLQSFLSVVPVAGPLQAHRTCLQFDEGTTPAGCTQFDSETSVTVPPSTNDAGDVAFTLSAAYLAQDTLVTVSASGGRSNTVLPAGSGGFANADTVVFVTGIATSVCTGNGGETIAYALSWQTDQFDRPVFGVVNVCPGAISSFFAAGLLDDAHKLLQHELTHVLVFTSDKFPLFRYKDAARTPRTPRDPLYPFLPAPAYNVAYSCGGYTYAAYAADNGTLRWLPERGTACTSFADANADGTCVTRLVTPAVREAGRAFFGCPTLPGVELENFDTFPCGMVGSHWESRVGWAEMMSPFYTGAAQDFTVLTLAVYDDSGWYSVDMTKASAEVPPAFGTTFGYKQGCAFAGGATCITHSGPANSPTYAITGTENSWGLVSSSGRSVCRFDRLGYGAVVVQSNPTPLPVAQRYWTSDPTRGGTNQQLDFCPIVFTDESAVCGSSSSSESGDENQGMRYGLNSLCLDNNLMDAALPPSAAVQPVGCFTFACSSATAGTVTVAAAPSAASRAPLTGRCTAAGQMLTFFGYRGGLVCPNATALCAPPGAAVAADVAAMGLAAVAAEQSAVQVAAQVPAQSRMPSQAPWVAGSDTGASSSGSGSSSSWAFSSSAIIGIAMAVLAVLVVGGILAAQRLHRQRQRPPPGNEQQQQQPQLASVGVGLPTMVSPAPPPRGLSAGTALAPPPAGYTWAATGVPNQYVAVPLSVPVATVVGYAPQQQGQQGPGQLQYYRSGPAFAVPVSARSAAASNGAVPALAAYWGPVARLAPTAPPQSPQQGDWSTVNL